MKSFLQIPIAAFVLLVSCQTLLSAPAKKYGFSLPDHLQEVSMRYKSVDDLILLPVVINDSIKVNLILDTGCRNLVLFGKRFQKLFKLEPDKKVQFSGLGSGRSVNGALSLSNKVAIDAVVGELLPVIVIPEQNLFHSFINVHGVIGYDVFTKFEIEINPKEKQITFRPAATATLNPDYIQVPIRIADSRPLIDCRVVFDKNRTHVCDLMIDTGSTLGLLLKTTDMDSYKFKFRPRETVLGRGLNGDIEGYQTNTEVLQLSALEIKNLPTGIIYSPWHNYASIGMNILKNYTLVLNYCKGYAGFKKIV
ncbi:aspartyl protease family protein [Ohtaekwangia sp.]|uniref:aspartyl protease family protein n=1 Tax=Ohtaekwangia sp. TaxID=2066019 RepID=UPI002F92B304